jgi:hypothetical protein
MQPLSVADFDSIDPKIDNRIIIVRSQFGDSGSVDAADDLSADGSVMTGNAIAPADADEDNQSIS